MSREWQPINRPPAGGDVLQMAVGLDGEIWAASSGGLFHLRSGEWRMETGLPVTQTGALHCSGKLILAAGLSGGLARSGDHGFSWQACRLDQTALPVLCFAASPRSSQDGVFLAGTAGDGILRSRDGGLTWQLENFGLRDFTVFSLLATGSWERREMAFAGTTGGLYYSPNGGRAWKFCGLEGQVVLSLAAIPDVDSQARLLAGTESEGLFSSQDSGRTWMSVPLGQDGQVTVNAIACDPQALLLATAEHGILCSSDGGVSWRVAPSSPQSAISLEYSQGTFFAGTVGEGLWLSTDHGLSWQRDEKLSTRRFQWFVRLPDGTAVSQDQGFQPLQTAPSQFLAAGINAGLWLAPATEGEWSCLESWPTERPILSLAVSDGKAWVGSLAGLWISAPPFSEWSLMLETPEAVTSLTSGLGWIWAGSASGRLWASNNQGLSWFSLNAPPQPAGGLPILDLALLVERQGEDTLLAASVDEARRQVQVWRARRVDLQNHNLEWELWLSERTDQRSVHLAVGGPAGMQVLVSIAAACLAPDPTGWRRFELPLRQGPISSLVWDPAEHAWLMAAAESLYTSTDGLNWESSPYPPGAQNWVSLQLAPGQSDHDELFALTIDGQVWKRS